MNLKHKEDDLTNTEFNNKILMYAIILGYCVIWKKGYVHQALRTSSLVWQGLVISSYNYIIIYCFHLKFYEILFTRNYSLKRL